MTAKALLERNLTRGSAAMMFCGEKGETGDDPL
jgi:hypothetical protein